MVANGPPDWVPRYTLYPATVEVLACQVSDTLCCTAATPVPVLAIAGGILDALLLKVSEAEALPEACGANVTVNVALWPADNVVGSDTPEKLNSELFEVAEEIVTLDPLAVSVLVNPFDEPTVTFPKLKLEGLIDS